MKIITPIGWDAGEVYYSAVYGISDWNYFSLHHNIIFPVLMMQNWLKVTEFASFLSPLRRMEILNLIFADASLILAFLTARKIFNKKMADIVLILGIILIGFHPTLSVIYSDSLALPFPIGILYCLLCADIRKEQWKKKLYVGISAILGVVGAFIKPTVVIVYIAATIVFMIRKWKKESVKGILVTVAVFICCSGLSYCAMSAYLKPVEDYALEQAPNAHPRGMLFYVGMGLEHRDTTEGYGCFNEPEVKWTNEHIWNENYKEEAIERIINRIKEFGVLGYTQHLADKLIWAGSDGTFFYGLEGEFHEEEQAPQDTLRGKLQNAFYIETEFYQHWFSSWLQGIWLLCVILCFITFFKKQTFEFSNIAKLSIIGLFMFLLIFENRSRYLFLYLPVLLIAMEPDISVEGILKGKQLKHDK